MPTTATDPTRAEHNFEAKIDVMSLTKQAEEQAARIQQFRRRDTPMTTSRDVPRSVSESSLSLDPGQYHAELDPFRSSMPLKFAYSMMAETRNWRANPWHKQSDELQTNEATTYSNEARTATFDDIASSTKAATSKEALTERSAIHRTEAVRNSMETKSANTKHPQAYSEKGHGDGKETRTVEPISESRGQTETQGMEEAATWRTVDEPPRPAASKRTLSSMISTKSGGSRDDLDSATVLFATEFARLALIESTFKSKAAGAAQAGASERSTSRVNTWSNRSSNLQKSRQNERRRAKQLDRNNDNSEEEDNSSGRDHKDGQDEAKPSQGRKVFACPSWSQNYLQHSRHNDCLGYDLRSISALKQHLRRIHKRSVRCPRCFEEFKEQHRLDEHLRETACVVRNLEDNLIDEAIKPDVWPEVNKRHHKLDPETHWFDIFRVLFPGQPTPWSPYIEGQINQKINQEQLSSLLDLFNAFSPHCLETMIKNLRENSITPLVIPERTRPIVCQALKQVVRRRPDLQHLEAHNMTRQEPRDVEVTDYDEYETVTPPGFVTSNQRAFGHYDGTSTTEHVAPYMTNCDQYSLPSGIPCSIYATGHSQWPTYPPTGSPTYNNSGDMNQDFSHVATFRPTSGNAFRTQTSPSWLTEQSKRFVSHSSNSSSNTDLQPNTYSSDESRMN